MGARHDQTADPVLQQQLLTTRRGTAFFSRKLNQLSDAQLDGPSLLPGWTRRHVVAHVGYNARALARLVQWAATGVQTPMYSSMEARNQEIDYGATLSPLALRNLHDHAAIHLNVEWRDLPETCWSAEVRTAQGRLVPVSETVWMRAREIWLHAIDLDNGAVFSDLPPSVLKRLLGDITGAWAARGEDPALLLRATDGRDPAGEAHTDGNTLDFGDQGAGSPLVVTGTLANLAAWASGRAAGGVSVDGGDAPRPPRWL